MARVHKTMVVLDDRGNEHKTSDPDNYYDEKVWSMPQRSARAEVPGQQQINVVRLGMTPHLEDVTIYSRVEWNGAEWDVVTPPAYHHGSRQVRHWSIDVRERP